ncbi:ABC transporter permease subunit [Georgenia thermotolerans]|uniref:ABC transporter permease subunit n=2 Tax=Georgenia thermotolerans TaxID=527326 RepID=A0A7J5UTN6_9MICO|nr:ABC transporter permease subunit [Georgenia thermotolerans]
MTDVAREFVALFGNATFWDKFGATTFSWSVGLAITAAVAVPLGLLIGSSRVLLESTSAVIEFLKPIPPIALIPLGLLMWGPALEMKLTLIVFGAMWPVLTQVVYGIREVDDVALSMARTYQLGRWQTITRIVVPSVLPFVAPGLRVSASIALIIAFVTEMVGGTEGLGQMLVAAQSSNAIAQMYALVVLTGLMGLAVNAAFRATEALMLRWHPSNRKELR